LLAYNPVTNTVSKVEVIPDSDEDKAGPVAAGVGSQGKESHGPLVLTPGPGGAAAAAEAEESGGKGKKGRWDKVSETTAFRNSGMVKVPEKQKGNVTYGSVPLPKCGGKAPLTPGLVPKLTKDYAKECIEAAKYVLEKEAEAKVAEVTVGSQGKESHGLLVLTPGPGGVAKGGGKGKSKGELDMEKALAKSSVADMEDDGKKKSGKPKAKAPRRSKRRSRRCSASGSSASTAAGGTRRPRRRRRRASAHGVERRAGTGCCRRRRRTTGSSTGRGRTRHRASSIATFA
jgi:hypothetical protein